MEAFYEAGKETWPCEVRISSGEIAVSYDGDTGPVTYSGKEVAPGHFKLEVVQPVRGRATLHQMPGDSVLEGWWIEEGEQGMWRIDLNEE